MDRRSELEQHLAFAKRLLEIRGYNSHLRESLLEEKKRIEEELLGLEAEGIQVVQKGSGKS